jgi:hypothetical protein
MIRKLQVGLWGKYFDMLNVKGQKLKIGIFSNFYFNKISYSKFALDVTGRFLNFPSLSNIHGKLPSLFFKSSFY